MVSVGRPSNQLARTAFCRRRPQSKPDLISRTRSNGVPARATGRERERERERNFTAGFPPFLPPCENNILDWSHSSASAVRSSSSNPSRLLERGLPPSSSPCFRRVAGSQQQSAGFLFALVTNARHLKLLSSHLSSTTTTSM